MSACAAEGGLPVPANTTPDEGMGPEGLPGGDPVASIIESRYQLRSHFQLTMGSLSPEPAYDLLQDLEQDPGAVLVSLAEAAGVPAADLLFDALPSSLSGKVTDWMSDAIASSGDLQVLMAWSRMVLAEMELRSSIALDALDADGYTQATHSLSSLVFHVDGREIEEAIPSIDALPGAGHSEVDVWVDRDADGVHMILGEQRFGLLFGEAAYRGLEGAIVAHYGTDLRGVLGNLIDCPAMAEEVANQCVLGVCVGHEAELQALCKGALDEAVDTIHDQFAVLDTELLRLRSGEARVAPGASGNRSVLQEGQWHAAADFGLGLRDLPASFSGESQL